MKRKTPEAYVQGAITDYLHAVRAWYMRMNTGGLRDQTGRLVRFGTPGCADLLCSRRGMFAWVEVKANTRYQQTELQKAFQATVEREGHEYVVVQSIDEFIQWWEGAK